MYHSELLLVMIMGNDITEQKRVEDVLLVSETRYRRLFETAQDGILLLDADSGQIIDVNPFLTDLIGYSKEELLNRKLWDIGFFTDINKLKNIFLEIKNKEYVRYEDLPLETKDGRSVDVEFVSNVYQVDGKKVIQCNVRDITERKHIEKALQESEERYATTLASIGDAIIATDIEGNITFMNTVAEDLTGWTFHEASMKLAKDVFNIINDNTRQKVEDPVTKVLEIGPVAGLANHTVLIRRDGTEVAIDDSCALIKDRKGNTLGVVLVFRDITERKQAEEALRESHQIIEGIINAIPVRVFWKDRDLVYLGCNAIFAQDAGFADPKDIVGKDDYHMGWRDQAELYRADDRQVIDSGRPKLLIEEPQTTPEGNTIVLLTSKIPLRSSKGEVIGVLGTYMDITERKRIEKALQESEKKYRLLIDTANESVIVAQDGLFKFVNPITFGLLGADSEQELIDRPFSEFIHPDDRSMVVENYRQRIANEASPPRYAFRMVTRDGIVKWVEINAALIEWQGRPATLNFLTDITERKQMEVALRESKDYLDKIINSIGDPIFVIDRQHRHNLVNDAMCALTNRTREEFIGKTPYDFFPREQVDVFLQKDETVFETGIENVNEETITDSQGVIRTIVTKKTLYTDASGNKSIVGIIRDITDRKRAEEELRLHRDHLEERVRERTAEMERFIYTVSHELRSPLVTVSGFVDLLKGDVEKGDSQRAFSDLIIISEAIAKMDRLLVDTLELSRIGRVANPPVDVPFGQIVQEALEQAAERIKSRNVAVSVAQDLPTVQVDMPRIVEVLVNLIENSVKYMGDLEGPKIEIGSRKDDNEIVFYVEDKGIGIEPKEHEKVFGLFYKVDGKSEGAGAGLSIVKRIIEVHGGRIWIESELGKGCTVCFTLPLANVG